MAKSNKKNNNQLLSPENYIRQKARNLAIFECKVDKDWERNQLASVLVARSHANGNISLCVYLVDVACLGVKNTLYRFNIAMEEYTDFLEDLDSGLSMQTISYELAHNIVYAGVEFAEDYGFKPHKDFTSTTRFMLQEDTDEIELIDIAVGGSDGNPMYVNSGHETVAREKQILAQLEKTAGKGNFTFISSFEEDEFDNPNADGYDDEQDFELSESMLKEMKAEFMSLADNDISTLSELELIKLIELSSDICDEICDESKVYDFIDSWDNELDLELTDEYPNEFIGLPENVVVTDKQGKLIDDIIIQLGINDKQAEKMLIELEKQIGKTSMIASFELELLKMISISDYQTKLAEYLNIYPDCAMLKLMTQLEKVFDESIDNLIEYMPDSNHIFKGRSLIAVFEMFRYLTNKMLFISKIGDINMTQAFILFLDDLELGNEVYEPLKSFAAIARLKSLRVYFESQQMA